MTKLPGVTWVTIGRVCDWTGLRVVETTVDAVTGVTARTPCPAAMATTSAGAAAVTALCCAWTTWAPVALAG